MAKAFFDQVGVNIKLVINSLGDAETRERYREALIAYLSSIWKSSRMIQSADYTKTSCVC
jgi:hypothetical protein